MPLDIVDGSTLAGTGRRTPTEPIARVYRAGNVSPPRTPSRRRKDPPSSYPRSARLAAATGASFFDDVHGYDRDSATDDDGDDHHDLTYSSKHIPRASLVDHMVMALDQFSITSAEPKYYEEDLKSYRHRGHTFSSSVSSESEVRTLQAQQSQSQTPKLMRRSSARYARDPAKLPSIFGEDEDPTRVRNYDSQRAAVPQKPRNRRNKSDDHKKSVEDAASMDLLHLKHLQNRLGPAGNRRSQSFDFGHRRREGTEDEQEIAPHPVIYSGPKAQKTPASPPPQTVSLSRRDSLKLSKNTVSKSTNNLRQIPGQPELASAPSVPKTTPTEISGQRPGLFKRFFTSHKTSTVSNPTAQAPMRGFSQEQNYQTTTNKLLKQSPKDHGDDPNKENVPPSLQKKPSSFFRRRKKSVTIAAVPPLPLTLNSAITTSETQPGRASPVSSLKAFMDPYLNDDHGKGHHRSQTPTSPLHTAYLAGNAQPTKALPSAQSTSARLVVPPKETFLTDNSSVEDEISATSDMDDTPRLQQQTSPGLAPRAAVTVEGSSIMRPVIEPRSSSYHSERLAIPPRTDSLSKIEASKPTSPTSPKLIQIALATQHRNTSGSDVSDYRSAPSTPDAVQNVASPILTTSPRLHISHPSMSDGPTVSELDKAQEIYNNGEDDVDGRSAAAWLGEVGSERERIRRAYMQLFDWTGHTILSALRALCSRLVLKAESQLIDRIFDAFAKRWCECNPRHGFKTTDVVHTICYSILLLNTDLHMADIGSKMTRGQFVKNAMSTIRSVVAEPDDSSPLLAVRSNSATDKISVDRDTSRIPSALGQRPSDHLARADSGDHKVDTKTLMDGPHTGSQGGWEVQIETVLKDFYYSIQREPLPLFGSENAPRYPPSTSNNNLLSLGGLRRTPSVLSKAHSESNRSRFGDSKSLGAKWNTKGRSRPRLGSTPGFGSSKNSLEDQSSAWSPSMSSTWSKASLGKTLTSMSVDSFATSGGAIGTDYQSSIGFANALSQAIIREDQLETQTEDGMKAVALLEDESLELEGAPWAKEGILKHKCHLDGVDKRSKDRNWNDCFAVIEKGWMRLFSFSVTAKSLRNRARTQKPGGVVGGGNWQDNAEEVWKFMLRHTIASSLPPPGYSKQRPFVWALSLPTGAVHLFSVGTPDIVKEFVSTANFWSARLSKEPMIGGVSSMEYGWSDNVVNRSLSDPRPSFTSSDTNFNLPRPSTQLSMRSSLDHGAGSIRPRLPGDKIHISDWTPPQQSLFASQLLEVDQLKALQQYVENIEAELQKHNTLRGPMVLAFSPKHSNYSKAMGNWEKKSAYLLREIVKFKNYTESLQNAQQARERIYRMRREEEKQRQADDDSMAIYQSWNMSTTESGKGTSSEGKS